MQFRFRFRWPLRQEAFVKFNCLFISEGQFVCLLGCLLACLFLKFVCLLARFVTFPGGWGLVIEIGGDLWFC